MYVNTFSQHVKYPRALVSEGALSAKKDTDFSWGLRINQKKEEFRIETAVNKDDMLTAVGMGAKVLSACFPSLPFVIMPTSLSSMLIYYICK